ncbi:MAG TPA: hypothetical protein PK006_02585 [Saprospiraceae bacterium]|nr:hypothetical protein [Saprospiraceae bacterium]
MHDIEPFYHWLDIYNSAEDEASPFFGQTYNEFGYDKKVYNYYIHPRWDEFEAENLFVKQLYTDYDDGVVVLELIGEWNDAIGNDIMFLKRDIIDKMRDQGISKYILLCEYVFNFHGSDDSYYEEWAEDVAEESGYICFISVLDHVLEEMKRSGIHRFVQMGKKWNDILWRKMDPISFVQFVESKL